MLLSLSVLSSLRVLVESVFREVKKQNTLNGWGEVALVVGLMCLEIGRSSPDEWREVGWRILWSEDCEALEMRSVGVVGDVEAVEDLGEGDEWGAVGGGDEVGVLGIEEIEELETVLALL